MQMLDCSFRLNDTNLSRITTEDPSTPLSCSICDVDSVEPSASTPYKYLNPRSNSLHSLMESLTPVRIENSCVLEPNVQTNECVICSQLFDSALELSVHFTELHIYETPPSKAKHTIHKLSQTAAYNTNVSNHLTSSLYPRPPNIPSCDYPRQNISDAITNTGIHSGEKPFECTECDYVISQNTNENFIGTPKMPILEIRSANLDENSANSSSLTLDLIEECELSGTFCEYRNIYSSLSIPAINLEIVSTEDTIPYNAESSQNHNSILSYDSEPFHTGERDNTMHMLPHVDEPVHVYPRKFKPITGHSYSLDPSKNNISFMCLNVCGVLDKIKNKDFLDYISKYEIISFCETKTDDADTEFVNDILGDLGYSTFIQNRHRLTNWRSGGVLVAVRRKLCSYVKRVMCTANFTIVLILDKSLFNFDKNIIYITAYIPPASSRYSSIDLFTSLSNIILDYDTDDYFHMLVGDLNAHTGTNTDLVTFDKHIIEMLDLDDDSRARLDIVETMTILDLPIARSSVDVSDDNGNYGRALLELCKNHMLCIFNGRAGEDRNIGKATTKKHSLLDYVIGSPYLLSKAKFLKSTLLIPCFLISIVLLNDNWLVTKPFPTQQIIYACRVQKTKMHPFFGIQTR